ncbi:hypothetical protein AZF01_21095 (plasmid) [Martelella sp. AD-3]|nr:hypothetical protein AZF01_21095 [Martelella sp. AD-3]
MTDKTQRNFPVSNHYEDLLVNAYENKKLIDQDAFSGIAQDEAYSVQSAVAQRLGQTPGGFKVAINGEGKAVAAPIYASRFTSSGGSLALPAEGVMGVEFELAFVLGKTITPEMAEAGEDAVLEAVDHFVFGIEVIGTRFSDQARSTAWAQLADNLTGIGYIAGTEKYSGKLDVDGEPLVLTANGAEIFNKPAKHPFGGVLKPVVAYAKSGEDRIGVLQAGSFITTGSLCGAVSFTAPCEVVGTISDRFSISASLTL